MGPEIGIAKLALRKQIRAALEGMTAARRGAASSEACALLEKQAVWQEARAILFYAPLREELDIWPLVTAALAAGRTVALPKFDPGSDRYVACRIQDLTRDLRRGKFGIREPNECCAVLPPDQLDLVLVPGVAFDVRGRRLGRGRGFYDRLLALMRGTTCGVVFDEQIIAQVPVEPHDARVNCLLTPTRWIEV